jgi:NAD(P)-dependent dehydrogenase (short-subunit alcohol dehydrogenase family)
VAEPERVVNVAGRAFLVTGGASGLGEAVVDALAAEGGQLVIADVNEEAGAAVATRLGEQAMFIKTDVTSEESVQAAIAAALERFGSLHGVVNCAGIAIAERAVGRNGPHSLETFTRVITVNLIGTFNVVRLAAAAMASNEPEDEGERGVIVNTASVAAFDGQIGQPAYSASKGGVAAMTLPLAREFARLGIRVVAIAPGLFDTPMLRGLPEEARASLGAQVPFPSRLGRPSEYGRLVRDIVENPMLNGEVIRLDGAIRMAPA